MQQGPNSEGKSIGGRYPGGPWKKTLSVPGFCSTSCIHFVSFGVPRPLLIRLQVRRRTDLFWTFSPDAIDLRAPSASRLDALALRRRCPCARRVASSVAVLTDCNCALSRARCTASAIVAASALNCASAAAACFAAASSLAFAFFSSSSFLDSQGRVQRARAARIDGVSARVLCSCEDNGRRRSAERGATKHRRCLSQRPGAQCSGGGGGGKSPVARRRRHATASSDILRSPRGEARHRARRLGRAIGRVVSQVLHRCPRPPPLFAPLILDQLRRHSCSRP